MMFKDFPARLIAASVAACLGVATAAPGEAGVLHASVARATPQARIAPQHGVPNWHANSVYSFSGPDGQFPQGEMEYAGSSAITALYGATQAGGANGDGTLFSFATPIVGLTNFYAFTGTSGMTPSGGLADLTGDSAIPGAFYGVTSAGGANGYGAIYVAGVSGAQEVLYSFTGGADGANPVGRLVEYNGAYYGTTSAGAAGFGTVFSYVPGGAFTTLHTFTGLADGGAPLAGLTSVAVIPASNYHARHSSLTGNADDAGKANPSFLLPVLFGTTSSNGLADGSGDGTIFSITPAGVLTTLHTFTDTPASPGAGPQAELASDFYGNLYGTTYTGGSAGVGEIFKLAPNGKVTVLHDFSIDPSTGIATTGANPDAPLTVSYFGQIYGTTSSGGSYGLGNVFELLPGGHFLVRHEFSGPDGAQPQGKLIEALDGLVYGTTYYGGASGDGTIYSISQN